MSGRRPLEGVELVLIDGNNMLHRQHGGIGEAGIRGILVELRRVLPNNVRALVVLDGHPAPGTGRQQRIGGGLGVRHAGSQSADDAIIAEVAALPWASRGRTIVVSDDRALSDRARTAGVLTRRLDWLAALPRASTAETSRRPTLGSRRPRPQRG